MGSALSTTIALTVALLALSMMYGPLAAFSEMFTAKLRYRTAPHATGKLVHRELAEPAQGRRRSKRAGEVGVTRAGKATLR